MTESGSERSTTTEYGVLLTLERGSKFIWAGRRMQYWSPEPTSKDEAIELAREKHDGEIEEIHDVRSREVPAPEKWDDDDPRILTDGGTERIWLPVCHDCKLDLTHPQADREGAEDAAERHEDRMGHSTGVRRDV